MHPEPFEKRPYLDWTLDRWKTGIIVLAFGGLVISSLAGPVSIPAMVGVQPGKGSAPALAATARVLAGTDDAQRHATSEPAQGAAPAAAATVIPPTPAAAAVAGLPAQAPLNIPLTLAGVGPNTKVPADSIRMLYGTAAAGSLVEVRDQATGPVADTDLSPGVTQEVVLGTTAADGDGLWQLSGFAPLPPGQHVLTVYQLGADGTIEGAASPVVVTVLEAGVQGPPSLATPSIKFPTLGAHLRSGPVTFVGSGLPGMTVRLYLDNRQVAEGMVSTREEWRLTPDVVLDAEAHVARVASVNPDGVIIAESAPVVFVVEAGPNEPQSRLLLPTPSLPLTISTLAFGDHRRQSLVVRGRATPHAGVSAWVGGQPVRFANALTDGGWQFWLFEEDNPSGEEWVEIRTSLGERLSAEARPVEDAAIVLFYAPAILSPKSGDVLTTRRPLVIGLAQPSNEVSVLVNRRVVGRVVADRQGLWAYQLTESLPAGYSTLIAEVESTWTTPGLISQVVVVTLAPSL